MKGGSLVSCSHHHHDAGTAALRCRVGRGRDRLVGSGVPVSNLQPNAIFKFGALHGVFGMPCWKNQNIPLYHDSRRDMQGLVKYLLRAMQ
jgi:hypothetical protein